MRISDWSSDVCSSDLKPEDVRAEIEAVLAEAYRQHPSSNSLHYAVVYEGFQAEGFELDMNMPVIPTLSDCCREVLGKVPPYTALTGTNDARFFTLYGNTQAPRQEERRVGKAGVSTSERRRS